MFAVKEKKVQKRYDEEFKHQAVELVIRSGRVICKRNTLATSCRAGTRTQAQIARERGSANTG
jgi:transposase-like protein